MGGGSWFKGAGKRGVQAHNGLREGKDLDVTSMVCLYSLSLKYHLQYLKTDLNKKKKVRRGGGFLSRNDRLFSIIKIIIINNYSF